MTFRKHILWLCLSTLVSVPLAAQQSDRELLRNASFDKTPPARHYAYGLEHGRRTASPFYHIFSATLYVWQNYAAPELAATGGYYPSNPEYFKRLTADYGLFPSIFYGIDRSVRNTKIGRATTPKDADGLIRDDTKRYGSE